MIAYSIHNLPSPFQTLLFLGYTQQMCLNNFTSLLDNQIFINNSFAPFGCYNGSRENILFYSW